MEFSIKWLQNNGVRKEESNNLSAVKMGLYRVKPQFEFVANKYKTLLKHWISIALNIFKFVKQKSNRSKHKPAKNVNVLKKSRPSTKRTALL